MNAPFCHVETFLHADVFNNGCRRFRTDIFAGRNGNKHEKAGQALPGEFLGKDEKRSK